jgi:LysM repeat protein
MADVVNDLDLNERLTAAQGSPGTDGAKVALWSIVNVLKNKKFSRALRGGLAVAALSGAGVAMAAPANAADGATWDALAQCESGGNWGTNTGNGFSGGLQFTPSTWAAYGGSGSPEGASRSEQIAVAEKVLAGQGWGAWPACSAKLGLSGNGGGAAAAAQSEVSTQSSQVQAEAPAPAAPVQAAPVQQAPVQQAPVQQAPAAPAVSGSTYTVQGGDTLGTIADKLGVAGGWEALYAANSGTVADANLIFVGQVLQLPA